MTSPSRKNRMGFRIAAPIFAVLLGIATVAGCEDQSNGAAKSTDTRTDALPTTGPPLGVVPPVSGVPGGMPIDDVDIPESTTTAGMTDRDITTTGVDADDTYDDVDTNADSNADFGTTGIDFNSTGIDAGSNG
ncbi:MAG: hypothetical protein H6817_03975 [Phycisphaerales bacterium]|nr:hypothetical protein [Phycisphaerales bacterium]